MLLMRVEAFKVIWWRQITWDGYLLVKAIIWHLFLTFHKCLKRKNMRTIHYGFLYSNIIISTAESTPSVENTNLTVWCMLCADFSTFLRTFMLWLGFSQFHFGLHRIFPLFLDECIFVFYLIATSVGRCYRSHLNNKSGRRKAWLFISHTQCLINFVSHSKRSDIRIRMCTKIALKREIHHNVIKSRSI